MVGLWTGVTLGKAAFNSEDRPLFIEARIATSLWSPSIVKCSLQ